METGAKPAYKSQEKGVIPFSAGEENSNYPSTHPGLFYNADKEVLKLLCQLIVFLGAGKAPCFLNAVRGPDRTKD